MQTVIPPSPPVLLPIAVALHTDFNDAIEILLAHDISPVFVVPFFWDIMLFPLMGLRRFEIGFCEAPHDIAQRNEGFTTEIGPFPGNLRAI